RRPSRPPLPLLTRNSRRSPHSREESFAMKKRRAPAKKFYTIQEANSALPLVRAIVSDIVALAAEIRRNYAQIEHVQRGDDALDDDSDGANDALQALRDGKEQMTVFVRELQQLGIELKDFHTGLIDFRSMMD